MVGARPCHAAPHPGIHLRLRKIRGQMRPQLLLKTGICAAQAFSYSWLLSGLMIRRSWVQAPLAPLGACPGLPGWLVPARGW
jgi:hypothetical protein